MKIKDVIIVMLLILSITLSVFSAIQVPLLGKGLLRGEKGEQGAQGVQGIQGEKGDKGDKGEKGDPFISNIGSKVELYIKITSVTYNAEEGLYVCVGKDEEFERRIVFKSLISNIENRSRYYIVGTIKEVGLYSSNNIYYPCLTINYTTLQKC